MKTRKKILSAGAVTAFSLSLALGAAHGQQQPGQPGEPGQQPQTQPGQPREAQAQQEFQTLRSSDLEGSRVVTPRGERLGTLEDLVLELEEGVFSYAVVAAGGFLGIGSDWRPVPPEALQLREVEMGIEVVLDIDEDQWEQAPTIERERIAELGQETLGQDIYEFYGQDWQAREQRATEFASPPGERGKADPSHAQQQQLQQQLEQSMTQAGVDQQQAQQEAERLAKQFSQEQPDQEEIQQQLEQALSRAGVDQDRAQQEAEQLSQQVHQQIQFAAPPEERGDREKPEDREKDEYGSPGERPEQAQTEQPGQQQVQQIEQQLQQAMTQAGVEQEQAQQEAQRLAQQFSEGQPDQEEIEQQVEEALLQAGVDQERAQQQAQQLSQRIHQQVQFGSPGERPEEEQEMQQQRDMPPQQPGAQQQDDELGAAEQHEQQATADQNVRLASDVTDLEIVNQHDEEIGQASDLLISPDQGRVAFVLFTEGTGLFPGDEEFAVAPQALQISEEQATLNITQEELRQAEMLSHQDVAQQAREQAGLDAQQAQQQPQLFRYQDPNGTPGVFGAPKRERDSDPRISPEAEEEPELEQPQRQSPPPQGREPAQPQQPGQSER